MNQIENLTSLTFKKNIEAEYNSRQILSEAVELIVSNLSESSIDAIVLIGGYGRGEGGVVETPNGFKPHNNFDLLIITHTDCQSKEESLNQSLEEIRSLHDIGIDISLMTTQQFAKQECLVIWYDICHGHKVLWGKPDFLSKFHQFTVDDIPDWDVRNLLVNRASLLLINRYILFHELNKKRYKTIIKHFIKAIVGYGDAFLYQKGEYHWSYRQKQLNMRKLNQQGLVNPDVAQLYEDAINFRFQPDYDQYLDIDLAQYNEDLMSTFEPIHRDFESQRLNQELIDWNNYQELASKHRVKELYTSPFLALKTIKKRLECNSNQHFTTTLKVNSWLLPTHELLPIVMPDLQYGSGIILDRRSLKEDCRHYLKQWQRYIDNNLSFHLNQLGLTL